MGLSALVILLLTAAVHLLILISFLFIYFKGNAIYITRLVPTLSVTC